MIIVVDHIRAKNAFFNAHNRMVELAPRFREAMTQRQETALKKKVEFEKEEKNRIDSLMQGYLAIESKRNFFNTKMVDDWLQAYCRQYPKIESHLSTAKFIGCNFNHIRPFNKAIESFANDQNRIAEYLLLTEYATQAIEFESFEVKILQSCESLEIVKQYQKILDTPGKYTMYDETGES